MYFDNKGSSFISKGYIKKNIYPILIWQQQKGGNFFCMERLREFVSHEGNLHATHVSGSGGFRCVAWVRRKSFQIPLLHATCVAKLFTVREYPYYAEPHSPFPITFQIKFVLVVDWLRPVDFKLMITISNKIFHYMRSIIVYGSIRVRKSFLEGHSIF